MGSSIVRIAPTRKAVLGTVLVLTVLLLLVGILGFKNLAYFRQAISGHIELMMSRKPISALVVDPEVPAELRHQLQLVLRMRQFAVDALSLPDNNSYEYYVELKGSNVAWNVFAAPSLSVAPITWCFPVAGCVTYRGYFSRKDAQDFASAIRQDGNDLYVAGVTAYSTLGWFDDPVLSTFIQREPWEVGSIIFHELAHQRLYLPGDSHFNEGFAVTVEREAVRRWLEFQGQRETLVSVKEGWRKHDAQVQLVLRGREQLSQLYSSDLDLSQKQQRKEEILRVLKVALCGENKSCEGKPLPRASRGELAEPNNAYLAAVATYYAHVPAFEALLRQTGNNLSEFYRAASELAQQPMKDRERTIRSLTSERRPDRTGHELCPESSPLLSQNTCPDGRIKESRLGNSTCCQAE